MARPLPDQIEYLGWVIDECGGVWRGGRRVKNPLRVQRAN